ncbi:phosphatase PAP2 family protein [Natronococcus wangiae]|uniref:phosphatase PAP2 family protein n=1 Tax=Natronococcus wangiae TaxID=3068275 RepID=UPI00273E86FE|nr:phosphatase PAP2 family protein [Natronococcus sp. AD5]
MGSGTLENVLFDEATNEAVRAALPDPAIRFFELATHLGDSATLLVVVALVYRFGAPSRQRTRGLVLAIALVALSRVVIGAHYLGDVLAGVALGFGIVALVSSFDPEPEPPFLLAGAIAVVSFAFGSTHYTTLTTGAAIGGTLAWRYAGHRRWAPTGASLLVLGIAYLPALVVLRTLTAGLDVHWIGDVLGYAAIVGFVVLVPAARERLNDRPVVVRLRSRLPFGGRTVDPDQLSDSRD